MEGSRMLFKSGSMKILGEVITESPTAGTVLTYMLERINPGNFLGVTNKEMMVQLGVSRATLYRALKVLKMKRAIRVEKFGGMSTYFANDAFAVYVGKTKLKRVEKGGVCGVYAITSGVSGRVYIGRSKDIHARYAAHMHSLRAGTHHCKEMSAEWEKHGTGIFTLKVLQECIDGDEEDAELTWIRRMVLEQEVGLFNKVGASIVARPQRGNPSPL